MSWSCRKLTLTQACRCRSLEDSAIVKKTLNPYRQCIANVAQDSLIRPRFGWFGLCQVLKFSNNLVFRASRQLALVFLKSYRVHRLLLPTRLIRRVRLKPRQASKRLRGLSWQSKLPLSKRSSIGSRSCRNYSLAEVPLEAVPQLKKNYR